MELSPVLIWLVVLVLALQIVEFGLRAGRALLRRMGHSHEPDLRERFLAMSPLEKIETFKLDQLDDEAQQFFLAAMDLPPEERRRITSLLRLGWNGGRSHASPPQGLPGQAAQPQAGAVALAPEPAGPSAQAASAQAGAGAEVVTLPLKSTHPKASAPGMVERR